VIVAVLLAVALAFTATALAIRAAPVLGLVDVPDAALKTHTRPVPAVGGLGVATGVFVTLVPAGRLGPRAALALAMLFLLGLVDDRSGLPPAVRLGVEAAAGALAGWGLVVTGSLPPVWIPVVLVAVVVGVNAVNLLDGMDGLAASVGAVAGLGSALLAVIAGVDALPAAVLAAALAGFLPLNWRPARAFLGDSGAYLVGGGLAYLAVALAAEQTALGSALTMLVVGGSTLGVFLLDLTITIVRRRRSGVALFEGDRSHVYDQLVDRGWSVERTVVTLAGIQAGIVLVAVLATWRLGPVPAAWIVGAVMTAVLLAAVAAGFVRTGGRG